MAAAPKRRGRKKGLGLKIALQPAIAEDDSAVPTDVQPASLASLAAAGQLDDLKIGSTTFKAGDLKVDRNGLHIGADDARDSVLFQDLEEIRTIGSGASSTVKLARHKTTGAHYALKCIGLYMKDMRQMLLTELHTLFQSDCDALVSFHGATYREGQVAVVLEYMNLGGLETVMAKTGPIPENVLACLSYQVLWGLAYLAYEKRIHRDIKPANVLVNTGGAVKLTDFGISREMQTAVLAKTFVGTFKYMAPERISGGAYDYASDLWSFGLVVLEAALGRYPYPESKSTVGYVSIVADGDVPVVPTDGTFTPQFADFISRILVKDPTKRATAAELLDHEWMMRHGCDSLHGTAAVVGGWLAERGLTSDIPLASEAGVGEGKDSDPVQGGASEGKK